jgi:hypothetical protein
MLYIEVGDDIWEALPVKCDTLEIFDESILVVNGAVLQFNSKIKLKEGK